MTNEFGDISEMCSPWFLHVWSHWAHDPSPELCTGETWEISKGFALLTRVRSIFPTSAFANGLKFETIVPLFATFRASLFDSKIRFWLLVRRAIGLLIGLVILRPLNTINNLAVDCFTAHVYRHPSLRNLV